MISQQIFFLKNNGKSFTLSIERKRKKISNKKMEKRSSTHTTVFLSFCLSIFQFFKVFFCSYISFDQIQDIFFIFSLVFSIRKNYVQQNENLMYNGRKNYSTLIQIYFVSITVRKYVK